MNTDAMNLQEIQRIGYEALNEKLGAYGTLRFLEIFHTGSGDYSKDRHKILKEKTADELVQKIKNMNKK